MNNESYSFIDELKSDWRFVIVGALLGAFVSVVLYVVLFYGYEALTIVRLGGTGTDVKSAMVSEFNSQLQEKVYTKGFAQRVAQKLGDPAVTDALPAKRYGGWNRYNLSSRLVVNGSMLEIVLGGKNKERTLKLAEMISVLIRQDDSKLLSPLVQRHKDDLANVERELARSSANVAELRKSVGDSSDATNTFMLMSSLLAREDRVADLKRKIIDLKSQISFAELRKPEVFASPNIVNKIINSWGVAAIIGLVGGLGAGYVLGMIFAGAGSKKGRPTETLINCSARSE